MEEIVRNIYVETGYDGVNVGAILTATGVICVDVPSYARDARDWAARLHRLSPYSVQHIILTDDNGDRLLNTRWLSAPLIAHQFTADKLKAFEKKYPTYIIDSLATRRPHRARELSSGPVERATFSFSGETTFFKSGHEIILRAASGPSLGSCWIYLPKSKILFAGDSVVVGTHPLLKAAVSAEWLRNMAWLKSNSAEIDTIVPGRGPIQSGDILKPIVEYLQAMRGEVKAHISSGGDKTSLPRLSSQFTERFSMNDLPKEWVQQQIINSLAFVYDEIQSTYKVEDGLNGFPT